MTNPTNPALDEQHWAISLDDWASDSFDWLGTHQEGVAGHYARYDGMKAEAVNKALEALRPLVEKMMYRSTAYGYKWREGDNDE